MKYSIALFIGATSAMKITQMDAPSFWPGPTWTQNHPSASGLIQLSSCEAAQLNGVTCGPSDTQLFATGMNGDEDLGQDITMKGEKFHYNQQSLVQWTPVEVKQDLEKNPLCHGTNGAPGVNCKVEACTGTNGPLDGHVGTPCTRAEPDAVPHYNTDPTAGRPYATTGDLTPSDPAPPVPAQVVLQLSADPAPAPEKVSVLDPKICKTHTSFYGQKK